MSRARRRPPAKPVVEPSLIDVDLASWAGERVARGGRRDALLGRVEALRLSLDGRAMEARVRGSRPLPYHVVVRAAEPRPAARCSCSPESSAPCRHAVAVIEAFRFPSPPAARGGGPRRRGRARGGAGRVIRQAPAAPGFVIIGGGESFATRDERIALARRQELTARRERARRARGPVCRIDPGAVGRRFEVESARGGARHVVTLRAGDEGRPHCTCRDFAENELQTCLHVERVRGWLGRNPQASDPAAGLAAWCQPRAWLEAVPEPLREIRIDGTAGAAPAGLERYFDGDGWLQPAPATRGPLSWALRALAAARRAARRQGWAWEIDPEVGERLRGAKHERRLSSQRAAFDTSPRVWHDVAERLKLRLHPYQREGVRFLARAGRAFLADDMGLGKSAQAIAAALALRRTTGGARALVVCPASLKHQWSQEIDKTCGEQGVVVEGPPARREAAYGAWCEGFLIVNYELVLRDLERIVATAPDLVILDEAQRIKNWDTQTARAVKRLRAPHAFVLTGTPLENRLTELHSLVEFLHPRALGPRWRLFPFHAVVEAHGRVIAYEGLDVLRRRLADFFLRRERREVLDELPPRTDNTFWTGMTALQRRPYRRHAALATALLSRKDALRPAEIRTLYRALTSMRMLCNAHALYAWEGSGRTLAHAAADGPADLRALHSPKLEEFAHVLDDLLDQSAEKIVVFSQWERMLRLARLVARDALGRRDLRGEIFHGGLDTRARGRMIDAFRSDPEFRVLFSTDAGSLGLNLQEAASIVVNLEVPWNPSVLEQRVGRVHRMGQRRSVQVLHFVTRGAIEERVRQVVEDKRALFDGLLVDEADSVVLSAAARSTFVARVRRLLRQDGANS